MVMKPLSSYRRHPRHGATRGKGGHSVSQSRGQLGQGRARAIPGPRARCALGGAEQRVPGVRPTVDPPHSFPRAARKKCHKPGGLQQQQCIVSLHTCHTIHCLWRLTIQNKCLCGVMLPLKPVRKNPSLPLCSCWWFTGTPWCSLACRGITTICCLSSHSALPVSVLTWMLLVQTSILLGVHPTLAWPHLNSLYLQWPHFQMRSHLKYSKLGLQHVFWGDTFQPITPLPGGPVLMLSQKDSEALKPFGTPGCCWFKFRQRKIPLWWRKSERWLHLRPEAVTGWSLWCTSRGQQMF